MGWSAQGGPAQEELDMEWEMLSLSPWGWRGLGWEQGTHPAMWPQCDRDLGSPTGSLCEYLGKQNLPVADTAVAALAPTVGSVLEPNRILTAPLLSQELRGRAGQSPHLPTTTLVTPRPLLSHCPVFGGSKAKTQEMGAGQQHSPGHCQTLPAPSQELCSQQGSKGDTNMSPSRCCAAVPCYQSNIK